MKSTGRTDPIIRIIFISTIMYLLFHFLFLWMYTNIDGYFYWAIGQYFQTGVYPFIPPFVYQLPTTISAPLYGMLLSIIGLLPRGDIWLHALQLLLLAVNTMILFHILISYSSKRTAAIIALLFLLFPANVIYTSTMMTEISAQTAMTVYLYLLHRFIKTNQESLVSTAMLFMGFMTLLRHQFLFLFLFTFAYQGFLIVRTKKFPFMDSLKAGIGVVIILAWVVVNHAITGVWGLSDTQRMPFYTNMVWNGKYYPPEDDPSVVSLRHYVPATADKYAEYWDLQDYILPHVNRSWNKVDELLGNVGIAAIRTHPWGYVKNGMRIFFETHGHRAPWWHNLQTYGTRDPVQPLYCDALASIQFCRPIIKTPYSYQLWNAYVEFSRHLYTLIAAPLMQYVFLPLLIITVIALPWKKRIYAVVYGLNMLPISYLAMVESRYLIPYYPLMIIISVVGAQCARSFVRSAVAKIQKAV